MKDIFALDEAMLSFGFERVSDDSINADGDMDEYRRVYLRERDCRKSELVIDSGAFDDKGSILVSSSDKCEKLISFSETNIENEVDCPF